MPDAPTRGVPVVIGVGNELRGDDAAGLLVAQRLRDRAATQAVVLVCEADPAELLPAWTGAEVAIVVDTVVSGAAPGTIQRFDVSATPLPAKLTAFSTHGLGVAEAIELAVRSTASPAAPSSTASREAPSRSARRWTRPSSAPSTRR